MSTEAFDRVLHLLDAHGVPYTLLEHRAEGNTERASKVRGHDLHDAAKCMITEIRDKGGGSHFVLAVVEGDRRISFRALKNLYRIKDVRLAPREAAEKYGKAVVGSISPFPLDTRLDLVVDVGLLDHDVIYFNAARLDRSLVVNVRDYLYVAAPRIARISR